MTVGHRAGAQVTLGAGASSTVPFEVGPIHLAVGGGLDRFASLSSRYTLFTSQLAASLGSPFRGFALSAGSERALNLSVPTHAVLRMSAWHRWGGVVYRLDVTSRLAWFGNISNESSPEGWADSAGYLVQQPDTFPTARRLHFDSWSEFTGGASWGSGRVRWGAVLGARPPVAGYPAVAWGHLTAIAPLARQVDLIAEGGSEPRRIALGVPADRYLHIGLRLSPFLPDAPAVRVTTRAPAALTIRPAGPHLWAVTLRIHATSTVEIAGDFDAWHPVPLVQEERDVWRATLAMDAGTYHMNVRVDGGTWLPPPGLAAVSDGFGGAAGLVQVR